MSASPWYYGRGRHDDGKGSAYALEQANTIEKLERAPSPSTFPPPSVILLTKGKGKVISYNNMPSNSTYCYSCREYDHVPFMYPLLHNVSYSEHETSFENEYDVECVHALNV